MIKFVNMISAKFDRKEEGQGMVEYALILVLVAAVAAAGFTTVQGSLDGALTSISGLFG